MGKKKKRYSYEDFAANAVFAAVRVQLSLYASNGSSLEEVASLARVMQESIAQAYEFAIRDASREITGHPDSESPLDLSDDNPFTGGNNE